MRRSYAEQFKRNAIGLVRSAGRSAAAVSRDLGLTKTVLGHWLQEERKRPKGKRHLQDRAFPATKSWLGLGVRTLGPKRRMR